MLGVLLKVFVRSRQTDDGRPEYRNPCHRHVAEILVLSALRLVHGSSSGLKGSCRLLLHPDWSRRTGERVRTSTGYARRFLQRSLS